MNNDKFFSIGAMLAVMAIGASDVRAANAKPVAEAPLTEAGQKLLGKYSDQLKALQAELAKDLPKIDEQQRSALQNAREAVKVAEAEANKAQQPENSIQTAKALVDHAKGKWIGDAEKNIAKAETTLKRATTEAEREAAQKELAKWRANKEEGIKALKERQQALDKLKNDESRIVQATHAAQAALAQAQSNELMAAKALLAKADAFLSGDKLDAKLVKCAVLADATPRGLAEFAMQGKEKEALVDKLLADTSLMKQMLEAEGAKDGRYGQAMQIYSDILNASPRAAKGIFQRLALGTSLELAVPMAQGGQHTPDVLQSGQKPIDPVKRYLSYEKAYLAGELDPAFKNMTAWECRLITNSSATDEELAWGREMLRNYRPDAIFTPDYNWRYSMVVRTDITYRHNEPDNAALGFYENIMNTGGVCGRRAFFGRFILRSFGIPTWGVTQTGHAAIGHWTPAGWVTNYGADWKHNWFEERSGTDFVLETKVQKYPAEYAKVLRALWAGSTLGERKVESRHPGTGGFWNVLALYQKKLIVETQKPAELAPVGADLAESNVPSKAEAIAEAEITADDKKIVVASDGVIRIPAAACSKPSNNTGQVVFMKSFSGGMQMHYNVGATEPFEYTIEAPADGKYAFVARLATVNLDQHLLIMPNGAKTPINLPLPYTKGSWAQTKPVEIALLKGKNVLRFTRNPPTDPKLQNWGLSIKDFTLTPMK